MNITLTGLYTVLLLIISNTFMTLAWYGHLKMAEMKWFQHLPLIAIIALSWGIAFFEYCFMVPANRIGFRGTGGPFSLIQLKVLQECITLIVFTIVSSFLFKSETLRWNHLLAFVLLVLAVYLVFKE